MRRREGAGVPAMLATFDPADWPGGFDAWVEARRRWAADNGWPGGPDAGPDGIDAVRQTPDAPWDASAV